MPYKSDTQRRFFHYAESKGEISPKVVKEYDTASKGKKLPEYVKGSKFSKLQSAMRKN